MHAAARLLVGAWLLALCFAVAAATQAHHGRIDLTGWRADRDGVVYLDGEWSFVANRLVGGNEPWPSDAVPIEVPGAWHRGAWPPYGAGTYRLVIDCDEPRPLTLFVPTAQTAARLFLNGQARGNQGRPGLTREAHQGASGTQTIFLNVLQCPADLRLQVSNFESPRGGLVRTLLLGTPQQLQDRRLAAAAGGGAASGTAFVLGIFSLLFYSGRRRDPIGLYFGLFCVAIALSTGIAPWRERVLQPYLEQFGFFVQFRLLGAANALVAGMYPLIVGQLYPRQAARRLITALGWAGVLLAALFCVSPAALLPAEGVAIWILSYAMTPYACWVLARAVTQRERGAIPMLGSLVLQVISVVYEGVLAGHSGELQIANFAIASIVLAPAWLMTQRFGQAMAAEELRAIEHGERADLLVRATKAGVLDLETPSGALRASDRYREMLGLSPQDDASTLPSLESLIHPEDREWVLERLAEPPARDTAAGVRHLEPMEFRMVRPDWAVLWVRCEAISIFGADGRALRHIRTFIDISHLKATEQRLSEMQSQLVEEARRAGMAQIATNVLHNVGNVLTSVNVSAHLASQRIRHSPAARLGAAAQLLKDLPRETDAAAEKQQQLAGYLRELSGELACEREEVLAELARLSTSVDHINNVVAMQQSYAGGSGMLQMASVADLVDDALRLQEHTLHRQGVAVQREYERVPALPVDKTRMMQVLVNLVENAAQAMADSDPGKRVLRIVVRRDGSWITIGMTDTGCGIAQENLARIFSHGFTTKPTGHGFGLHACVVAAREMDGELTAYSDGPGTGATFALRIRAGAVPAGSPAPAGEVAADVQRA
jgi:signal transduction histidine kinase